jgi:hypothetical protein
MKISRDYVEMHKYVTIVAVMMFVNGLLFLVTSLRGISLITIEFLPSRTAKCLASSIKGVVRILPKLMIIELMHFCVMWLNSFLLKSGISEK